MKHAKLSEILLVCSGDLRLSANQNCWPAQLEMEQKLTAAIEKFGWSVKRAHDYNSSKKHGFIDSQRMDIDIFRNIDPKQPLIVAESVWQYSHHVLAGLTTRVWSNRQVHDANIAIHFRQQLRVVLGRYF